MEDKHRYNYGHIYFTGAGFFGLGGLARFSLDLFGPEEKHIGASEMVVQGRIGGHSAPDRL